MKNSEKAIGYCRISTDKQSGPDHYSLDLQADILAEMAAQRDTRLTAVFTDVGSGSKTSRAGLQKLREAIERPDVKWLFVYRLNRLARNLKLLLSIFEHCQKNNVKVVSKMEPEITETASGQLQLSVFGAVAQFGRAVTMESQANALAEKKRKGEVLSSKVPYGYTYRDKHAVVDIEAAAVVQWLYRQYTTTDMGYRRLTEACNRQFGLTLKQAHVSRILRNSHYVGKDPNYPQIVLESEFKRAQDKRTSHHVNKTYNDSWLHGKLVCPTCGRKLLVETPTRNGKRIRYYSCRRHGHTYSIRGEVVEQLVWNRLSYLLQASNWPEAVQLKVMKQLSERPMISSDDLRSQLESGQINSTEFIAKVSRLKQVDLRQQQVTNNYRQAINCVRQAFEKPTATSTDFWQGMLDHVNLTMDKLVEGVFIKKWPMVNLLTTEGEDK